ncbi:DEAD/DEAH box helicase [Rossellomorea vietnamensis]|uniref:DEAD/DEAH box helicase n=1 Tax=Rossellomorea vietnamensis TaxID=218284 RepID=A0A5D4M312_9BACI|nr:DEAD/DEAH box helicase [Rossellomorea vietnamensis]TYR96269.1 DEAD/DEAH box helicase [Rossellomorea vietnamensis]
MSFVKNLQDSIHRGFINHTYGKSTKYKPKLLINNTQNKENVLSSLVEELTHCNDFFFSVAFITESGLATLKSYLWDLNQKGIKGRILTSTFLQFNQPKVFKELLKISNLEVRLTSLKGFHSKGYIFKHDTHYSLIVGSSNLTAQALKANYEWNVKLNSHEDGEIVHHFVDQFEEVWRESDLLTTEWIEEYEKLYQGPPSYGSQIVELPSQYQTNSVEEALKVQPNKMQEAALQSIQHVREQGKEKALVISATGTGKTYLSAFDVRCFAPRRMLFIVHREQILQKAKADYQKILGGADRDYGILSGNSKQQDARYLFATIQTLSKDNALHQFDPSEFDYVLVDEVHKAGAKSYLKVMDYFKPKFLMGMTATPERTDDFNIYQLFDYNIAYEIRLQEALEEEMLCPFHYFGVTDYEYDGQLLDETAALSKLVTKERVRHILEKINYYSHSGEKVRGLMFCSRKEEAEKLSEALNNHGLNTVALLGNHSPEERLLRVNQLENGLLDYIITVDIFNEGVDIPSVNQVVMLRQTQSSIIFIQQLGRGLRKHDSKDFVTVIDFIGNYKNNYLIPVALSGDRSQNKDTIRRRTKDTHYIQGVSTINFEEIAKKQIFKAINDSKLTALKILRDAYTELKNRIGRVPYLYDFIEHNSIDPSVIVMEHTNYYKFLDKVKEEIPELSKYEFDVLTMLSQEILNGKRKHEVVLLDLLLGSDTVLKERFVEELASHDCHTDEATLNSVQRVLDLSFYTQNSVKKYGHKPVVLFENNIYTFNETLQEKLSSNPYFQLLVEDIVQTAKAKSLSYDCSEQLTLFQKYSRKDACKLLNWQNDESATVFGYKTKHGTCPIFVTYHKNEDVDSSVNYTEEFINQEVFRWSTRSNRRLNSDEVQTIINAKKLGIDLHFFIKKDNDEGTDFYYLGKATPELGSEEEGTMVNDKGKELPVVRMNLMLENEVESSLYHYLIEDK